MVGVTVYYLSSSGGETLNVVFVAILCGGLAHGLITPVLQQEGLCRLSYASVTSRPEVHVT